MQPIILIAILVVIVLLLDLLTMRWLWKHKVGFKKAESSLPEIHPSRPTIQIQPYLTFFIALALIGLGQYWLASQGKVSYGISIWLSKYFFLGTPNLDNILIGLPVLIAGCIILICTLRRFRLPEEANPGGLLKNILPLAALRSRRVLPWIGGASLVFICLILSLTTRLYSGLSVFLWLAVPVVFLVVAWGWDRQSGTSLSPNLARADLLWMTGLTLAGLLVAAFRLQSLPDQMIFDESTFWTTARDIARGIYHPGIFDYGVYTYGILSSIGQAAALKLFGINFWGWRFSSVLAGVMTIPPLYLLGRELFDRRVAVVSSVALLTAPYFLAFARLGYNNIQTLFIVTLAIYWFYLGYKRSSAFYLLLAGCAAGLGSYTYSAARSLLPIVGLFLLACLIYRRKNYRSLLKAGIIFGLGWMLLSLPGAAYGNAVSPELTRTKLLESIFFNTGYSGIFLSRNSAFENAPRVTIDQATLFFSPGPYAVLLVRGIFRTFIAFHQSFLVNEHFISSPLAGPFAVIFYIIGSALALANFRQRRYALLIIWFGFMALALSAADTFPPRHQHMVGLIPAMALLIGAGLVALVDMLARLLPRLTRANHTFLIGLLTLVAAGSGLYNFFVTMPQNYRPNFEQIISWYGLYSQGQPVYYVYSLYENPDTKPFVMKEVVRDIPYQDVSAVALAANPVLVRFDPRGIVFFSPDVSNVVLPALEKIWGKFPQLRKFYDRDGFIIGESAWLPPVPIVQPLTFQAQVADSFNRPVAWLLVLLAGWLTFFLIARRDWFGRAPAWLRGALEWLFQPATVQEPGVPIRKFE